ncbi:MAG: hypothetical protein RI935_514 [Candidatus Parcubacteria bacterium]
MNTTSNESLFEYTRREVDALLLAYKNYKELDAQIASGLILSEKPKFNLLGKPGVMQNLDPLAEAKKRLDEIGNGMKFQNPLIWLIYKYEAYQHEDKPLKTVADLIAHCEVDGICHRRFDAINRYLREKHNGGDITNLAFVSPETSMEDLAKDKRFIAICFDLSFQTKWSRHENDRAGKWKHYAFDKEPVEKYSCGCC